MRIYLLALILFFSSLVSSLAFAIPEAELGTRFMPELVPWMTKNFSRGQFTGNDFARINYYALRRNQPEGVLIVSPGKSESSLKYAEVLYDLKDLNYDIFIIDHRGQGESERLLVDPVKSHVNRFQDYVDDFSMFVLAVVKPSTYKKSVLIAHSMGGAIASAFLRAHPRDVSGALLFAPMLEINTGIFPGLGADLLANLLKYTGFSTSYAPGQKPYDPNARFSENTVTGSEARFQMSRTLYNSRPELRIGGTTVNWVKQSLEYTADLRNTPEIYQIPTLMFQSGKDQLVRPSGQNKACVILSPDFCRLYRYENAQHEILMETDAIRNDALARARGFIQKL